MYLNVYVGAAYSYSVPQVVLPLVSTGGHSRQTVGQPA